MTSPQKPEWKNVTPTKTVHLPPPAVKSVDRLTGKQIGAIGTVIVDLILAQVALALGGIDILGVKPFSFLTQWGYDLQQQAADAYKNAFAIVDAQEGNPAGTTTTGTLNQIYSAAAAVNQSAVNGETNAGIAQGNVETTWNALWDGAKGTTGSANKTAADVKSAIFEVSTTANDGYDLADGADGKAQTTIDGIYSAVMGGEYTGIPADYVKPQLTGLTYTARNNVASGSNLVVDPSGENSKFWNGTVQPGVAQNSNTNYVRSGSKSVQITSAGATERTLYFNTIDTGAVQPYIVRQSEIYQIECYVYAPNARGTVRLVVQFNGGTPSMMTFAAAAAGWTLITSQVQIPAGVYTASFGIQLAPDTTAGDVFYVDSMLVREITNAQIAQGNVESTWNQIYNGVYNTNATGKGLTDVKDALVVTKGQADKGVTDAGTAQTTVDEGLIAGANMVIGPDFENTNIKRIPYFINAAIPQDYSTEQAHGGTKSWKWVQTAPYNCGLYFAPTQTSPRFIVTADQWYYMEAWLLRAANTGTANLRFGVLWEDSYGAQTGVYDTITNPAAGTWTKYSKFVKAPAGTVGAKFFIMAVGNSTAGNVFYVDDVVVALASKIPPKTVVSADVSEIDGSIIQSGTVNVDYIPTTDVGAAINPKSGSGAVLTRKSTTNYKANPGRNQVGNDFYDTAEVSPSSDIEMVMSGSQYTGAFKALTTGWYEIIIGYGLKQIVSNGYSLAPCLFKGSSMATLTAYKVGSEAWATTGAWVRYCQGVFTVYLTAGSYVRAGYDAIYGNITDPNDAIIKADNTGVENYISIALLNKSYA